MKITPKTKIFLDANVLICAIKNPNGGSGAILELAKKKMFQAVFTLLIIKEAQKNIRNKLDKQYLLKFYQELLDYKDWIKTNPEINELKNYLSIIDQKDAHVIAGAVKHKADYLITLDKKHFFTPKLKKAKLSFVITTPKGFLQELRKQHNRKNL